jgi:hypothetical protein
MDKLSLDMSVVNSAGKKTLGFFVGELDLAEIVEIESKIVPIFLETLNKQKAELK